jgi:hypothetical protein
MAKCPNCKTGNFTWSPFHIFGINTYTCGSYVTSKGKKLRISKRCKNRREKLEKLNIAKEFSSTPSGRLGKLSGEDLRTLKLKPLLDQAIEEKVKLEVDLDGGAGYAASFLDEAFGGLVEKYNYDPKVLRETLTFISNEEPDLIDEIWYYIEEKYVS